MIVQQGFLGRQWAKDTGGVINLNAFGANNNGLGALAPVQYDHSPALGNIDSDTVAQASAFTGIILLLGFLWLSSYAAKEIYK